METCMNKFKSFTSIEQSKKLAEILPLESADMHWKNGISDKYIQCFTPFVSDDYRSNVDFDYDIPCWSLASLLDVLPTNLQIALAINDFQGDRKEKYVIGSVEHDKYDCYADNPVDACVDMIEKLNELNLL